MIGELNVPFWCWLLLIGVVAVSLVVDLAGHRGGRGQGKKSAIVWSLVWIGLSVAFGAFIAYEFGWPTASEFATAWLVEKSLSVDNLFVFLLVFSRLKIPEGDQHRVLFWGILGALVTRGIFIGAGAALLDAWHGVLYLMGAFLVFTGIRTALEKTDAEEEEESKIIAFMERHLPYTKNLDGHRFFTMENGRRLATPLFLALLVIEVTDIIFAVDSIPAVFAVTEEPFIVYSSNVFAILGLRALYLVLAAMLSSLVYLRYGLAVILIFAGAKMITSSFFHIPQWASLAVVGGVLTLTVLLSLHARKRQAAKPEAHSG